MKYFVKSFIFLTLLVFSMSANYSHQALAVGIEELGSEISQSQVSNTASENAGSSEINCALSSIVGKVNAPSGLNVRNAPWGDIEDIIENGSEIEVVGREGEWLKIKHNGKISFVHSDYVDTASNSCKSVSQQVKQADNAANVEVKNAQPAAEAAPPLASANASVSLDSADTPYFYQGDNSITPWQTCQNTSVAMVLSKYGWTGTPDDITSRFGRFQAQTPSGLAEVFNTLAAEAGIKARIKAHTGESMDYVNSILAQNKPVIVHGYFTGGGHVITLTGFDGTNYTANDPAGEWCQRKGGGYQSDNSGKGVKYDKYAMAEAIEDGEIWCHEIYFVN